MEEEKGISVGLIPDGNRRWGRQYRQSEIGGHKAGSDQIKQLIEKARDMGDIDTFFAWGLSCKNREGRSALEVAGIETVIRERLVDLRENFVDKPENKDIRLVHLGRPEHMAYQTYGVLCGLIRHTRDRSGMIVALCIDYDGHDEQERALKTCVGAGDDVCNWHKYLDFPLRTGTPFHPVDLIIRTGAERSRFDWEQETGFPGEIIGYDNEFLWGYRSETRVYMKEVLLPDYQCHHFEKDIGRFRCAKQRRGK